LAVDFSGYSDFWDSVIAAGIPMQMKKPILWLIK